MKTASLIINPSSGREKSVKLAYQVEKTLNQKYDEITIHYTKKSGDAAFFAFKAAESRADAIFLMGGDGTVNEGINGIASFSIKPVLGFIPTGTVNDFARAIGISNDPETAIDELLYLKEKKIDIGKINHHYFSNSTAIGTIPKAVQQVSQNKKKWFGALAYFIEGFKVLRKNKAYTFHIEVDGEQFSEKSILVLISSSFSVGGMETLIPDAQVNDGNLHLIVLKGAKVWDKLNILPKLITGTITKDNQVIYRKFKKGKIRIEENEEVFCNVDGEKGDSLPIELTILEKHLTVFAAPK